MISVHKLDGSNEAAQSLVGNSQITGLLSAENRRRRSNKPIIEGDGYRVSYRELFDNVCRLGTFFQQQNLTCGDRVVVISDDDSAITTLFFGLIRHGITVTILNPQGSEAEMVTLSKAMDPAMMFVDRPVIERVNAFSDRDDVVAIDPGARRSRGPSLFRRQRSEAQTSGFPGISATNERSPTWSQAAANAQRNSCASCFTTIQTRSLPDAIWWS